MVLRGLIGSPGHGRLCIVSCFFLRLETVLQIVSLHPGRAVSEGHSPHYYMAGCAGRQDEPNPALTDWARWSYLANLGLFTKFSQENFLWSQLTKAFVSNFCKSVFDLTVSFYRWIQKTKQLRASKWVKTKKMNSWRCWWVSWTTHYKIKFFGIWPYSKSFIEQACLVKMARYRSRSFFAFLWAEALTSHLVNNVYLNTCYCWVCLRGSSVDVMGELAFSWSNLLTKQQVCYGSEDQGNRWLRT